MSVVFLWFFMAWAMICCPAVRACSVCFFGASNDSSSAAIRMAVVCLLLALLAVLVFFGKFFLDIRKRQQLIPKKM
ncbi:MAG: hypothetical protein A3D87_00680 [Omnitrophica WOR_2 bacterium RIFCSPHIGHO2_02_FULL_50_17]|nr:MAG: hypothetical protein A3D87_00680 [Omnitrophica WOR_2 bacterium RIFCSPHIGHO2_02_FULL_50_17]